MYRVLISGVWILDVHYTENSQIKLQIVETEKNIQCRTINNLSCVMHILYSLYAR